MMIGAATISLIQLLHHPALQVSNSMMMTVVNMVMVVVVIMVVVVVIMLMVMVMVVIDIELVLVFSFPHCVHQDRCQVSQVILKS